MSDDPFEILGVSADATDEQIRRAWRKKIQQTHPDVAGEHFTHEAARINGAFRQIETQADRDAYRRSAVGSTLTCSECGAAGLDQSDLLHHYILHEATARSVGCQRCYRSPASNVRFTGVTGFLLGRQHWEIEGRLCRPCGRGAFRYAQARLLTTGWWSIFAFVATPFLLLANIGRHSSFRNATRMPTPADPALDRVAAGQPVFARPGVLIVAALFVAMTVWMVASGSESSSASIPRSVPTTVAPTQQPQTTRPVATTTPPALFSPWEEGDCLAINELTSAVEWVACGFRADGIITDIVSSEFDCPSGTIGTIDVREQPGSGNYACVAEY